MSRSPDALDGGQGTTCLARLSRAAYALLVCFLLGACAAGGGEGGVREVWYQAPGAGWQDAAVRGVTLFRTDGSTSRVVAAPVIATLRGVMDRLEKAGSARAELALAEAEPPGAFLFTYEGRQFMTFSLSWLDRLGTDPDAIAAVASHELAHLRLGHSSAERAERERTSRVRSRVGGMLLSAIGVPLGGAITSAATSAYLRSFTHDEELAAGELGRALLVAAGYDPCGIQRVVSLYKDPKIEIPHPWLSAHEGVGEAVTGCP